MPSTAPRTFPAKPVAIATPLKPLAVAAVAYAVQIYADFSGYTDMAIDAGRAHGLRSQDITAAIGQAQTEFSTLGWEMLSKTPLPTP